MSQPKPADRDILQRYADLQVELGTIGFDAENPFHSSRYASLPHILAIITPKVDAASFVIQPVLALDYLETRLVDIETGTIVNQAKFKIPQDITHPQKLGSLITYGRRYTLSTLLNLRIDEDDDGNTASQPEPTANAQPKFIDDDQQATIKGLLQQLPDDVYASFHDHYKIQHVSELTVQQYPKVLQQLNTKITTEAKKAEAVA